MKFRLSDTFLGKFKTQKPPFGFNGLGELTYLRTYSRIKEDGKNEVWWETVKRVVEGTFNMQKRWIEEHQLGWNNKKAQKSAQEMYERVFSMKFLPPGRGLWAMGSAIVEERGLHASLNNCFAYETEIITAYGIKKIGDCVDTEQLLFARCGQKVLSKISSFGKQHLLKLYLIKDDTERVIYATPNHRWYLLGRGRFESVYTKDLRFGDKLESSDPEFNTPEPWEVLNVEETSRYEEVYCATVPGHGCFTLAGNILTGNCAYVSTATLKEDLAKPFCFLMDMSMLGVGVGFDTNGAGAFDVKQPLGETKTIQISDDREGWVDSVRQLIESYFVGGNPVVFDYSLIRGAGATIKGFGGVSSGPEPLKELHKEISKTLDKNADSPITISTIVDIMNMIGKCVVAGNVRRTAEIVFGDYNSNEYLDLKNYNKNPDREAFGWASNNSIFADLGMDYGSAAARTAINGEPGFAWLENMQNYSRMNNGPDYKDHRVRGGNPCLEQSLESYELCCVTYDTKIQTKNGIVAIGDVVGKSVEVWNGKEWSEVEPFLAGKNKNIYRVTMSDGSILDVTDNHKWSVKNNNSFIEKQTKELKLGMELPEFEISGLDKDDYFSAKTITENYAGHAIDIEGLNNIQMIARRAKLNVDISDGTVKIIKRNIQKIKSIQYIGKADSYCFNEPKRHMGVFGNVLTHQCLVETFPHNHSSLDDYKVTLKYAYLYAKTVTLGKTHWAETNRVMLRNRRIGCSMSGIAQFVTDHGLHSFKQWCEEGYKAIERYDDVYSDWLAIPKSIKKTSIKPSGTVSLLAGATPGMHYPEDRFYIRRMRIGKNSNLIQPLIDAGYKVEPCFGQEDSTVVVEIPVKIADNIRTINEVSMWEQLSLAAFLQKYWADNQVSSTVTFKPEESNQIQYALNYFQYQLKGISFLPKVEKGAYRQMPYEGITEAQYDETTKNLRPIVFVNIENEEADVEKFCNNDTCLIK